MKNKFKTFPIVGMLPFQSSRSIFSSREQEKDFARKFPMENHTKKQKARTFPNKQLSYFLG